MIVHCAILSFDIVATIVEVNFGSGLTSHSFVGVNFKCIGELSFGLDETPVSSLFPNSASVSCQKKFETLFDMLFTVVGVNSDSRAESACIHMFRCMIHRIEAILILRLYY